ncbi:MAG: LPXTG cell wall anchor domain-containing protein, partial [Clostridia bacterium]|nr:LPXTG cell wall anchor domain-containing protein [Clostridia bacterium]
YADAEGEEEVTAADLVIAKLVKEEAEDKPADKPAGDDSDKSPATGESVASVAAVAALMGAAFVLVRKSKKA